METTMDLDVEIAVQHRQNVYSFIDFLYDNKDTFSGEINDILKVKDMRMQQMQLKPNEEYQDRVKYEKLGKEISETVKNISSTKAISQRARELGLYPDNYMGVEVRNKLLIGRHMKSIDPEEINLIIDKKNKYVEVRKIPNVNVLFDGSFLHDLDVALRSFFGAFHGLGIDVTDMDGFISEGIKLSYSTQPNNALSHDAQTKSNTPDTDAYTYTTEAVQTHRKRYDIDTALVREIFSFCQKLGVFVEDFTEIDLINKLAEADLSGKIYTKRNKLKIRTIVYVFYRDYLLNINMAIADEWYSDAVRYLGISKSECSNIPNGEFYDGLSEVINSYVDQNLVKKKH